MTEKFKESIDRGKRIWSSFNDLSKAFDCIDHIFCIAKLFAFGVSHLPLKLIYPYLSNRTQQDKINKNFSGRTDTEFGLTQGSVVGTLLFSINKIDLFYECKDSNVVSHTDDTQYRNYVQQTYLV